MNITILIILQIVKMAHNFIMNYILFHSFFKIDVNYNLFHCYFTCMTYRSVRMIYATEWHMFLHRLIKAILICFYLPQFMYINIITHTQR